MKDWEAKHPA